jgi:hypothetical protein
MERVGPIEQAGSGVWNVSGCSSGSENSTIGSGMRRSVRQALHQAERKINRLRAELRRLGRPDPAAWTVPPEVFAARMSSIPEGIEVGQGRVAVSFAPEDRPSGRQIAEAEASLRARIDQEKISTQKESYSSSLPSKWRGNGLALCRSSDPGYRIGVHQGGRSSKVAAAPPPRALDLGEADPVAMREKTEELQAARTEELHWQLRASFCRNSPD